MDMIAPLPQQGAQSCNSLSSLSLFIHIALYSMLLPAFSGGKHTVIFRFDEKDYGNGRKWVDAPHNDTASLIHVLFNFS